MSGRDARRSSGRARKALLMVGVVLLGCRQSLAQKKPPQPVTGPRWDAIELDLTQSPRAQQILPGLPTNGWSYSGSVRAGPANALTPVPNSYLGPILSAHTGDVVIVRLHNQIGQDGVTHWHGLDVPAEMDGYPTATFPDGATFTYQFSVKNRAGTYWYHPHTNMQTVEQVYAGLAGYFIVHDQEEEALKLPSGEFDLPVCIQDTTFDASNQRVYNPNMMAGFFGTTILVNGWPNYTHSAASRVYRLRLLNGSISRIYKLAFSDGTPMVVIGTDGGLLDAPRTYPYLMLAPGERAEVWADFSNKPVGTQITLQSLAFTSNAGQGNPLDVMRFSIDRTQTETKTLPPTLSSITRYQLQDAVNLTNPKVYAISGAGGMFTINGGAFTPGYVAPNETAQCDTLEVITVTNTSGTPIIPHPMHFHGRQFQILDRSVAAAGLASWNTVKDGLMDQGWKDTFLIMPYETVRILVRHSTYPGMYVYHCHNLVHEDMDMMRNFQLVR